MGLLIALGTWWGVMRSGLGVRSRRTMRTSKSTDWRWWGGI